MDYISEPFQYSFMVRALIVSVLVGVMCPILGAYVITRGRAFMGDALAHSVLPAMVVAFMLGFSPFFAAVPAGILIAVLMGGVSRRTGISEDTSIGIIFAGMFALGLVMLSTAPNINVDIEDLLLGQVLGVSRTDVYVSLGLTALVLAGLYAFHRQLVYTTFDIVGAAVVGIKTRMIEYVLLALLALVIVIGIQATGIVLVMAMLITPATAAYLLTRRFVEVMALGAMIGAASAITGLYLSYSVDLPSGPAMALVATGIFALAAVGKRRLAKGFFSVVVTMLAILQLGLSGLTAIVELFADDGEVWSRLLLVLVHPLSALTLLLATVIPKPGVRFLAVVLVLQLISFGGDATVSGLIIGGVIEGDWWPPLVFMVVPIVGIIHLAGRLKDARSQVSEPEGRCTL